MIRVAKHAVEIDHAIELTGGANPTVDLLALGFVFRRVQREWADRDGEAFNRAEGSTIDWDSSCVRTFNELPITLNDLVNSNYLVGIRASWPASANVVDSQRHADMSQPGLTEHIPIKASERVGTNPHIKHP